MGGHNSSTKEVQTQQALRKAQDDLEQRVEEQTAEISKAGRRLGDEVEYRERAEEAEAELEAQRRLNKSKGSGLFVLVRVLEFHSWAATRTQRWGKKGKKGTHLIDLSGENRSVPFTPRRARVCPAGVCFHVLNRAVARLPLFEKPEDDDALD